MEYHHHQNSSSNRSDDNDDVVGWFEGLSDMAGPVQTQTLRRILELNWGVEYLKKWVGDGDHIAELEDSELESLYRRLVPLSTHADLEPYIHRIADGDTSPILTQQPITTLSLSSGTTDGRQKYVPFTKHSAQTTLQIFRLAATYRSRSYPIREGGRILEFIYSSRQLMSKGGLQVGTATTHYYNSEEFKIKQEKTKSFTCSPKEVISIGDYKQSTYCHLLLGLFFSEEVEFITSTFAYSLVQAFAALEDLWTELCLDLRHGTLSPGRVQAPGPREAVLRVLRPSPGLAQRIQQACEGLVGQAWRELVPALWPNAKYLYSIMTGSMQPYLRKLRHYAGDQIPLVSADYGSTESWIGANLDPCVPPEDVAFVVVPTFSYFEFIPLSRSTTRHGCNGDDFVEGSPVPLSQVRIGQEYEIVLTTFTGLYRYRLGDVVEVVGFHNATPKLNFICRRNLILTVNIDKNTERDLQIVVQQGSDLLSAAKTAELVDFTSHADVASGHYVIYWEIEGHAGDGLLEECCATMDASFVDHGYVVSRRTRSIGPLELRIVGRGTFRKIMERFIAGGAALSQFKTPRCTSNAAILSILDSCTLNSFRSTAYSE